MILLFLAIWMLSRYPSQARPHFFTDKGIFSAHWWSERQEEEAVFAEARNKEMVFIGRNARQV